uniref:Calcineurin-like phosphoesterase domain-containing protein n=1 Tax=Pseudo-nitzschia australis TaxID=44445 RepID=A0A7S4ADG0_9STRA
MQQYSYRQLITQKNFVMIGVPVVAAASFCFWAAQSNTDGTGSRSSPNTSSSKNAQHTFKTTRKRFNYGIAVAESSRDGDNSNINVDADLHSHSHSRRSFQTPADKFFRENKRIPLPLVPHARLDDLLSSSSSSSSSTSASTTSSSSENNNNDSNSNNTILVIGDVHGCYDELLALHAKAVKEHNSGVDFSYTILVGDLCNKGPKSARVIRHVRETPNWFSVRGNHDDAALAAALGDQKRLQKKTYQWVVGGERSNENENQTNERKNDKDDDSSVVVVIGRTTDDEESSSSSSSSVVGLSDDDVHWLSQLPYTIRIPGDYFGRDEADTDTLVVHAGLVPNKELEEQTTTTMTTIRDLLVRCNEDGKFTHYEYYKGGAKPANVCVENNNDDDDDDDDDDDAKMSMPCNEAVAWASVWNGPQKVVFGHDARRKLQLYANDWATGLDTGAVYGGELTGIILPKRKLVSVKSNEYSPITTPKKSRTNSKR